MEREYDEKGDIQMSIEKNIAGQDNACPVCRQNIGGGGIRYRPSARQV